MRINKSLSVIFFLFALLLIFSWSKIYAIAKKVSSIENLLSKNCFINIVTGEVDEWRVATNHLSTKNLFGITDKSNKTQGVHYDYAIFCVGFLKNSDAFQDYADFVSFPRSS